MDLNGCPDRHGGIIELEDSSNPRRSRHNRGTIAFNSLISGIAFHSVLADYGFTLAVADQLSPIS